MVRFWGGNADDRDPGAYVLRVMAGRWAVCRLGFWLLRQADWNTRIVRHCQLHLRLSGAPVPRGRPGLVRASLLQWGRLWRAVPELAKADAAAWAVRLRQLHADIRALSDRQPGPRQPLRDRDACQLQHALLERFFRERLRLVLPPEADAWVRYRASSEALRDFFDFCASRDRLTSREDVELALVEFAAVIRQYRTQHGDQNPPRDFFWTSAHTQDRRLTGSRHRRFWEAGRRLSQIYWGKNPLQRVKGEHALAAWVQTILTSRLEPWPTLPRWDLRTTLVFEGYLQGLRLLAEVSVYLSEVHDSPQRRHLLQRAVADLRRGAEAFSAGRRWPSRY